MSWSSDNLRSVIPILRMFDVPATRRFYVDYLGCSIVSELGEGAGEPAYVIVTRDLDGLHRELAAKGYPFVNPGIEPAPGGGREMIVIDPGLQLVAVLRAGLNTMPI